MCSCLYRSYWRPWFGLQHSVPTRRSSDLTRTSPEEIGPSLRRSERISSAPPGISVISGLYSTLVSSSQAITEIPGGRSEEHTSELQSRGHLVSRLLLE